VQDGSQEAHPSERVTYLRELAEEFPVPHQVTQPRKNSVSKTPPPEPPAEPTVEDLVEKLVRASAAGIAESQKIEIGGKLLAAGFQIEKLVREPLNVPESFYRVLGVNRDGQVETRQVFNLLVLLIERLNKIFEYTRITWESVSGEQLNIDPHAWEFSSGEIIDLDSFAIRSKTGSTGITRFLWDRFTESTRQLLSDHGRKCSTSVRLREFDIRLLSSDEDDSIPGGGVRLIIVGAGADGSLHIRIFDEIGQKVVDRAKDNLPNKANEIEGLKAQLAGLWDQDQLSLDQKQSIMATVMSIVGPTWLRHQLVEELNAVIYGRLIYEEERFSGVALSNATKKLLEFNPKNAGVFRLNRLLLQDAYPGELQKNLLARMLAPLLTADTDITDKGFDAAVDTELKTEKLVRAMVIATLEGRQLFAQRHFRDFIAQERKERYDLRHPVGVFGGNSARDYWEDFSKDTDDYDQTTFEDSFGDAVVEAVKTSSSYKTFIS